MAKKKEAGQGGGADAAKAFTDFLGTLTLGEETTHGPFLRAALLSGTKQTSAHGWPISKPSSSSKVFQSSGGTVAPAP